MSLITIGGLKKEIKNLTVTSTGRRIFTVPLKKKILKFHYQEGIKMSIIGKNLDIYEQTLHKWKRTYGNEKTGYTFGRKVRMDLRTKALAVKEIIENNKTQLEMAKKYKVNPSTMHAWLHKYRDNYKELLDMPDGIPHLIKEEKMIYGDKNMAEIITLMEEQNQELESVLVLMQQVGFSKTSVKEAKEKKRQQEADIATVKAAEKVIKKRA